VTKKSDEAFMEIALAEAAKGLGHTSPNPAVGAVIVKNGRVLAVGHHARAGADHAEVDALRKLGFRAEGCTLYSTLEPCNHWGRTGPCTEAIIEAGVRRVVFGAIDPNPKVKGRGMKRLGASGIEVVPRVLEERCTELNECFNWAVVHNRPFTVLKAAVSLDGRTATRRGESKWITSKEARTAGHLLRSKLDAVVVGVETVLADDPLLTARIRGARDPIRVVLDSTLRTPIGSKIATSAKDVRTIVATTKRAPPKKRRALEAKGIEVLPLRSTRAGRVDLEAVLEALSAREVNGILVEGGAEVHGAFTDAKLVQKIVLFVAPLIIGGDLARPAFGGHGFERLEEALRLDDVRVDRVGPDLMITAWVRV
jgi:diaminohydroxyphosphoribosylaminopyrimidine deaminase / 5-amino-6-(5-phosphoribosylamino)uracil reductase